MKVTNLILRCIMRKLISTIIVSTLLIGGCSTVDKEAKHSSQSIPEEVPASQYKGQGFHNQQLKKVLSHMRKNIVKNTKNLANNFLKIILALMLKPQMLQEVVMASKSMFIAMIMTLCLMQASLLIRNQSMKKAPCEAMIMEIP